MLSTNRWHFCRRKCDTYVNERCRRKKERSKQGHTNNKATQHTQSSQAPGTSVRSQAFLHTHNVTRNKKLSNFYCVLRWRARRKAWERDYNTLKAVTFPKKKKRTKVGFEPTTLRTLDRVLYQLSFMYINKARHQYFVYIHDM